jgi:hypothetical protein
LFEESGVEEEEEAEEEEEEEEQEEATTAVTDGGRISSAANLKNKEIELLSESIRQLGKSWVASAKDAHEALTDAIQQHQTNCLQFEEEKIWIQQLCSKSLHGAGPEIVQIDMLGDRVLTRRSTLMLCATSPLARQFDGTVWTQSPLCGGQKVRECSESESDSDDDADVVYLQQVSLRMFLPRVAGALAINRLDAA